MGQSLQSPTRLVMDEQIEFFIDAYNEDAYEHIVGTVLVNNNLTKTITKIVNDYQQDNTHFLTLEGSWESYRLLMPDKDETGPHTHYSLYHYYED